VNNDDNLCYTSCWLQVQSARYFKLETSSKTWVSLSALCQLSQLLCYANCPQKWCRTNFSKKWAHLGRNLYQIICKELRTLMLVGPTKAECGTI
jgi:hypothetical protein